MNTAELVQRTRDRLGQGAEIFFPTPLIITLGLNFAQRLLVLKNPSLLVQRVLVTLAPDQVFIDLRDAAQRLFLVQRLALGDVTTQTPVPTGGQVGDLRRTSLPTLRSQRNWFIVRRAFPSHWYRHGLWWLCTWPRAMQTVTLTLVYTAMPTPLTSDAPFQVCDLPVQWHEVVANVAADVLQVIEGAGTCDNAMKRLNTVLDTEPLHVLSKSLGALSYRQTLQRPA